MENEISFMEVASVFDGLHFVEELTSGGDGSSVGGGDSASETSKERCRLDQLATSPGTDSSI